MENKMKWIINNKKYEALGYKLNEYEGKELNLITVYDLHKLQKDSPDTALINIFGDVTTAKDANDDERFGYSAYAIL